VTVAVNRQRRAEAVAVAVAVAPQPQRGRRRRVSWKMSYLARLWRRGEWRSLALG